MVSGLADLWRGKPVPVEGWKARFLGLAAVLYRGEARLGQGGRGKVHLCCTLAACCWVSFLPEQQVITGCGR